MQIKPAFLFYFVFFALIASLSIEVAEARKTVPKRKLAIAKEDFRQFVYSHDLINKWREYIAKYKLNEMFRSLKSLKNNCKINQIGTLETLHKLSIDNKTIIKTIVRFFMTSPKY